MNPRTGKVTTPTSFFEKHWRFEQFQDIFNDQKRQQLISQIPESERWNIYFTVGDCFEEKERELKEQWAIPFDIDKLEFVDGIDPRTTATDVARVAATAIGVEYNNLGVVFSGNGVHLYILLNYAIRSKEYFDENRDHYHAIASRIDEALKREGLRGKTDTSVWSHARIMRLPDTENRKEGKPSRQACVLNSTLAPVGYYLAEQSGLGDLPQNDVVPDSVLRQYPSPDSDAVVKGCLFLQHCKSKPNQIDEPAWYAMMSVTSRLENGRELTHSLSAGHQGYSPEETDDKIDQALRASGPRTCKDIDTRWAGCPKCPFYKKVTSPIMIRGENYLRSKDFGFRKQVIPKDGGAPRPGAPDYSDLLKFFAQTFPYICIEKAAKVFIFNGKFWEEMSNDRIKAWMNQHVKHAPSTTEMKEFVGRLHVTHVEKSSWFSDKSRFKMNFQNGTLDLRTMAFELHNSDHGFLNILSFPYNPLAVSPRWEQFLQDSMANDGELIQLLEEFGGYALSGDPYPSWGEKYLVLYGDGENGKSIYLDVLSEIAGRDSYSAIMAQDFNDSNSRYSLFGKLFNKSEETSKGAFAESQILKAMTGGGDITAELKYENQITFKNTAKIIMSVNDLPYNMDNTRGFIRRILIVPFEVTFAPGHPKRDPDLRQKLYAELPGICNRLIAAYKQAKDRGRFVDSAVVTKHINQYREDTDIVFRFLGDWCQVTEPRDDMCEAKDEVFASYVGYCRDSEIRPMSQVHFWRQAKKHIEQFDAREGRGQREGTGARKRLIKGFKLLNRQV